MAPLQSNYNDNGGPYNLPAVGIYSTLHFLNTNDRYYQNMLEAVNKVKLVKGVGIPSSVKQLVDGPGEGDWVVVKPCVLHLSVGQVIEWEAGSMHRTWWTVILLTKKSFTDEYIQFTAHGVTDPGDFTYPINVWCPIAWAYIHELPKPMASISFMSYGGSSSGGGSAGSDQVVRGTSLVATAGSGSEGCIGTSFLTVSASSSEAGGIGSATVGAGTGARKARGARGVMGRAWKVLKHGLLGL